MTKIVLDAAMSLNGFWADADGHSVYPVEDMHTSGMIDPLIARTGAVVMSRRSFDMAEDPDWYCDNYEFQVPIMVIGTAPSAQAPRSNGRISFTFVETFETALLAARLAASDRDVMIIGEASAARSAITSGQVDELILRIVPLVLQGGEPLFDGMAADSGFRPIAATTTAQATHIHLRALAKGAAER